jgi:hypothetical protein
VRRTFSPSGSLDRASYAVIGFVAFAIKFGFDRLVARRAFGLAWPLQNYWLPFGQPATLASRSTHDYEMLAAMLALSLPFAWVGIVTTLKRLRAVGWPVWLVVLFFVPVVNLVLFALLCASPDAPNVSDESLRAAPGLARFVPENVAGAFVVAIAVTGALGLGLIVLGTVVLRDYGWGVFVAVPFSQGAIAMLIVGARRPAPLGRGLCAAIGSVILTALLMFVFPLEGAGCIVMALPLAIAFACIGAIVGYNVQHRPRLPAGVISGLVVLLAAAPCVLSATWLEPNRAPTIAVTTSVDVDATPETVWKNVVSFPDLPPPTQLIFKLGLAYPERARIVGAGVGAVRYCEFSTGTFVEPVTVWDAPRLLHFGVAANPAPMRELSPYGSVATPHLTGFLEAHEGEFRLVALPGGRTRLTGTTWYTDRLWPQAYWELYSDPIIHAIHERVLEHIKMLSEAHDRRKD